MGVTDSPLHVHADDPDVVLDPLRIGWVTVDRSWSVTSVNGPGEFILGRSAAELVGRNIWELFPGARELEFGQVYESVMSTGEGQSFDAFYPGLNGWFENRVRATPEGIGVYFLDITARKAADAAAEHAARRARFAADAMEALAASLDVEANVDLLAQLVVPELCRWSVVLATGADDRFVLAGSWHDDESQRTSAAELAAVVLATPPDALSDVVRSGQIAMLSVDDFLDPAAAARHGTADVLGSDTVALLPMAARDRVVGVLCLFRDGTPDDEQIDSGRDIAARAAVAIDNSSTYARAERALQQAEAAGRRLLLLARVSEVLSDTTDLDAAVGELTRLVVPELADWALVTVIDDDGVVRDVGYAHRDPSLLAALAAYSGRRSSGMTEAAPRATVLRTGQPQIIEHMTAEQLRKAQPDEVTYEIVRGLDPAGVATVPLVSGGRTFGVLTLVTTSERGAHSADEVASALEIGRRAGLAMQASRAAWHAQNLAESVQRNVLAVTAPAEGLRVATRYRPANVDRQIGGDWFDTFPSPDGSTIVTIGDVMGHDVFAIAAMAQLRTFMQACAWTVQHSPAEVLRVTDQATSSLGRSVFATALTADLAPAAPDGTVQMRWSNAGHLPAVLITPDGTAALLQAHNVDVPLGVKPERERREHRCTLEAGSMIVLYTDGLIERRDRDIDDGFAALLAVAEKHWREDPDSFADALMDELTCDGLISDDVAVLALRVGELAADVHAAGTAVDIELPNQLTAAGIARDRVRTLCEHLPTECLQDAILLTSELVGNALRHGAAPITLHVRVGASSARIGVTDAGAENPVLPDGLPDLAKPSGRGLLIVQTLATGWSVAPAEGRAGKTVWFHVGGSA